MKENTAWILTYMLPSPNMIAWVSGELLSRCKNPEQRVAELYEQREHSCSGTQQQRLSQRAAQCPERRTQAHRRCLKKPSKSPPAKPHKINGRISPIRLFHGVGSETGRA
jgi:hypothetical protein